MNLIAIRYVSIAIVAPPVVEIRLILTAFSWIKKSKSDINFPKITNNGVPGGCGTPREYEQAINSPQSQKERVGAMVRK